jgi:hypothetical protein
MRRLRRSGLCLVAMLALGAIGAGTASAAEYELTGLPELGRCVKVEGTKQGSKTVYSGLYKGKNCGRQSPTKTGKYEFHPGPGPLRAFEGGGGESLTLQTVSGRTIFCGNAETKGEYTGGKSETLIFVAEGCADSVLHESCQSLASEEKEPKPIPGRIKSLPLKGELGFISGKGGKRPLIGWDIKPEAGTIVASFECGPFLTGTQVMLEGSYIPQIKPTSKMVEEFHFKYKQSKGKQSPEKLEGGEKDTLTAKFAKGLEAPTTEAIGFGMTEEVITEEELMYKTKSRGASAPLQR